MSQPLTPEMRLQLEADTRRDAPLSSPRARQPRGSPVPGGVRITLEHVMKLIKQEKDARLALEEEVTQLKSALAEERKARESLEGEVAQLRSG